MAFNFTAVSPGDDILATHPNNLLADIKIAHHQEAGATLLVNADIDALAAIAYSKLNLTGTILNADINASAAIAWSKISKSGSNLTDLATYTHNSLQSLQGGVATEYYHLTSTQHTNLTTYDAELAAFFAATDITGAEAEELTDGSETTKHKHALPYIAVGSGTRTTAEGSGNEDIALSFTPKLVMVTASYPDSVSGGSKCDGFSDGTNHGCTGVRDPGTTMESYSNSSNVIYLLNGAGTLRWNATASFAVSNTLRLVFTASSAAVDCNYTYLALR